MEPYYENEGWLTPSELAFMALDASKIDIVLATLISQLAVVRATQMTPDLEKELMVLIQNFLKKNIPNLDALAKQSKAKYN